MDSVVCLNVLEHVEQDLLGLQNILSVLKPGGRAIILVPHGQDVFGTLDVALGHFRRYFTPKNQTKMEQWAFGRGKDSELQPHLQAALVCKRPVQILKRKTLGSGQMKVIRQLRSHCR